MKRDELVKFLDDVLELPRFSGDVSNNGLQIEGCDEVKKLLFAVDGCQEVFDRAVEEKADFIFVHHGISWGGGIKRWVGMDAVRFRTLFGNDISLYAAHLPLDAHALYGNNAVLSDLLGLEKREEFFVYDGVPIGFHGVLPEPAPLFEIAELLGGALEVEPLLRGEHDRIIRRVAVVSGGGGVDSLHAAADAGADLLVTGEMEHIMHHAARELGVAVIALGHYASETTGVLAMQKLVAEKFGIDTIFAEVPTGL
ncbi:MAG: Nif3-like dinuclear metal center hexameric protein [Lentisphaeria bacterium]|nr:Nif3-like dinuclear metal center hexameric protein [Lentisphaeria bacterium]